MPSTVTPQLRRAYAQNYSVPQLQQLLKEKLAALDKLDRIVNATTAGGTSYQRELLITHQEYITMIQSIIDEKEGHTDPAEAAPTVFAFHHPPH